jgi:ubiquitin C-terminal hydrolase
MPSLVSEKKIDLKPLNTKVKVKQFHYKTMGFQDVEAPRFQDNPHMKLVRLSALSTGRFYPPRKYSWYSFLLEAESMPWP